MANSEESTVKNITYVVDPSDGESRTLWVHLRDDHPVWDFLACLDDEDNWSDKQISLLAQKIGEAYFEGLADRDWIVVNEISKAVIHAISEAESKIEPIGDIEVNVTRRQQEVA